MKNLIFLSALLLLSIACNTTSKNSYAENDMEGGFIELLDVPATMQSAPQESTASNEASKKVIKTGSIDFKSKDIEKDYKQIIQLLPKFKAYIENENQSKNHYRINYTMTIRVASVAYDTLYSSLTGLSVQVENKSSNIEDVTEQFYDLKIRITNKKALEQRYVELLKKATRVSEILEIERNINNIRTDIERIEGQFKYLNKQISYSTIHLSFYEVLPDTYQHDGFGARLFSAFVDGWSGFLSFVIGITSLWPFVFLVIGVVYLVRKVKTYWKGRG